jgi:hypothetical protein
MNWFWNVIARLFGDWHDKDYHPPTPKDENATGLGWHGDRKEDHLPQRHRAREFSAVSEAEEIERAEARKREQRDRFHEGLNGD